MKSVLWELYGMSSNAMQCEVSELDDILANLELEHDEIEVEDNENNEDSKQHRYCQVRTTSKWSAR